MTSSKPSLSLDDMLQADRKKKKHEELWNTIRSKDRRQSAPGLIPKRGAAGNSLASRMGINKRSASVQNLKSNLRGLRGVAPPSRPSSTSGIDPTSKTVVQPSRFQSAIREDEISIKGRAKPSTFMVVASNFSPGTTAGDIESVMAPFGDLVSCRLISAQPTVMAEMVFGELSAAQNVIDYFNNKRADGRLLYVYLKDPVPNQFPKTYPRSEAPRPNVQTEVMDLDTEDSTSGTQVGRPRRAEPTLQDGRFGFGDNTYVANGVGRRRGRDAQYEGSGLRSDDLISRGRGSRRRGN